MEKNLKEQYTQQNLKIFDRSEDKLNSKQCSVAVKSGKKQQKPQTEEILKSWFVQIFKQ